MSEQQENSQAEENTSASQAAETSSAIEAARQEAEKFKNEYLYLRAEFENYRKHAIKERSDLAKFGAERMAVELLNVLDNFERALQNEVNVENFQTFVQGVQMTATEFKNAFKKFGIEDIPSLGQSFDPQKHEALGTEETESVPEGMISREFKKAYKMHDKLIRPAQVMIARKPQETT
jgi:molecular chaperone GrpE